MKKMITLYLTLATLSALGNDSSPSIEKRKPMIREASINLPESLTVWPEGKKPFASTDDADFPTLTYYLPSAEYRTGQTVLVIPGGGYGMVSTPKEGHRPAQLLAVNGIAAAVLEYRHLPQHHPVPLLDAQRAMRILRQKAIENQLDPNKIGCMGFSAGGHLSGSLATQPVVQEGLIGDALDSISCMPNFFIMIYPVVSFTAPCSHFGSRDNLLGVNAPKELVEQLSIEKSVTAETPPCFIYHGQADDVVPVENAILLYQALTQHGVPATMHLYENEVHGGGLGNNHPWGRLLLEWLAKHE